MNWHRKFQITLGCITEVLVAWNLLATAVKLIDRISDLLPKWITIAVPVLVLIGALVFSMYWQGNQQEGTKTKPTQQVAKRSKRTK